MVDEEARSATLLMIQDYWDSCKLSNEYFVSLSKLPYNRKNYFYIPWSVYPTCLDSIPYWRDYSHPLVLSTKFTKRIRKTCIDVV